MGVDLRLLTSGWMSRIRDGAERPREGRITMLEESLEGVQNDVIYFALWTGRELDRIK